MNPGAAFGFLANTSETFRYFFFIGITVLVIVLIIYYIVKSKSQNMLYVISLTLIFGGAVGNLIDRIRFGAVVDFLDVLYRHLRTGRHLMWLIQQFPWRRVDDLGNDCSTQKRSKQ